MGRILDYFRDLLGDHEDTPYSAVHYSPPPQMPCPKPMAKITDLPQELIDDILKHLTPVSQVCLVLSNKRFYWNSAHLLKNTAFSWSHFDGIVVPTSENTRKTLLLRIENKRWLFCSDCILLHRPEAFSSFEIDYPARVRHCKNPGFERICPCLRIRKAQLYPRLSQEIEKFGKVTNSMGAEITHYMKNWHQCQFSNDHFTYKLWVSIARIENKLMKFYCTYELFIKEQDPGKGSHDNRMMICPHTNALEWIDDDEDSPELSCVYSGCQFTSSVRVEKTEKGRKYFIAIDRKFNKDLVWEY